MLKVQKLSKNYGNKKILEDLELEFHPADFSVLLGENGAGKSTLMRVLTAQEETNSGEVLHNNLSIWRSDASYRSQLAYLSEDISVNFEGSLEEFTKVYRSVYPTWEPDVLHFLGKERNFFDLNENFSNLSRGQRMQFLLALNLARRPKVLVIDEVTAVMDVFARKYFVDILKNYATDEKAIVLLATNIVSELDFITDSLSILNRGKIIETGPYKEIVEKYTKYRFQKDELSIVESDERFIWVGNNADGSQSYVIKNDLLGDKPVDKKYLDRRSLSIAELFSYCMESYSRKFQYAEVA